MSLVPNQSYANDNTPLFATQSQLEAIVTSIAPVSLIASPPIVVNPVPLFPNTPYAFSLVSQVTDVNAMYDVNALLVVQVDTGSATDDFVEVLITVGGPSPPARWTWREPVVGGYAYIAARTRLICSVSDVVKMNVVVIQGLGSTATYVGSLDMMNVTRVA